MTQAIDKNGLELNAAALEAVRSLVVQIGNIGFNLKQPGQLSQQPDLAAVFARIQDMADEAKAHLSARSPDPPAMGAAPGWMAPEHSEARSKWAKDRIEQGHALSPSPTPASEPPAPAPSADAQVVAFRWRMSEDDHWSAPHPIEHLPSLLPDDGRIIEYLGPLASPPRTEEGGSRDQGLEEAAREFAQHKNWSLSYSTKVFGDDEDEPHHDQWVVFEEGGSINDREWEVMGFGDTPEDAILAAVRFHQQRAETKGRAPASPKEHG